MGFCRCWIYRRVHRCLHDHREVSRFPSFHFMRLCWFLQGPRHISRVARRRLLSPPHLQMLLCMCMASTTKPTNPSTTSYVYRALQSAHIFLLTITCRSPMPLVPPTALLLWPKFYTMNSPSKKDWWRPFMRRRRLRKQSMVRPTKIGVVVVVSTTTSFPLRPALPKPLGKLFRLCRADWRAFCPNVSRTY